MRLKRALFLITLSLVLCWATGLFGAEAYMLRFPDIYKDKVVFSYAGDLWIADINGGPARQITSSEGFEFFPRFSPDGKWVAFTGQYDGYSQVFIVPSEGGTPKQLTFHPSFGFTDNLVIDWTNDGKYIVFRSVFDFWNTRCGRLYKISKDGGWPEPFPFVEGATGSFSPDGNKFAMNRIDRNFRTWKRYKGGMAQDVWIYDFEKDTIKRMTDWVGTDRHPMWYDDKIYFTSDRTGILNLYYIDLKNNNEIKQVTDYKDYDVKWPALGGDSMVFEYGFQLYRMTLPDQKITPLKIDISFDKAELEPKIINAAANIGSGHLAPGSKRIVASARGEIFTVPAEKGDVRNLTGTPGVNEKSVAWSPDGKWIAYISDESGAEELYLIDQYGKNKTQLTKDSKFIIYNPTWSPDSKKIAYFDADKNLFYINIKTKEVVTVDKAIIGLINNYSWSPDNKWIAYDKTAENFFGSIFLYSLDKKKVYRVTDDTMNDFSPVFDPDGKYLFFLSSRSLTPTLGAFELSYIYQNTRRVHLITLQKDAPDLFAPESDEVEVKEEKPAPPKGDDKKSEDKKDEKAAKEPKSNDIKIDLENIGDRIVALPVDPSLTVGLEAASGVVFYSKIENPLAGFLTGGPTGFPLYAFDLKKKKEVKILDGVNFYTLSADKKNILWGTRTHFGIAPAAAAPIDVSKGKPIAALKLETIKDPIAEWKQMYLEAWRLEKNFFYVVNMHGVDWDAIREKYIKFIPHLTHRLDLTYIIGEMIAELCIGHTYVGGGEMPGVRPTAIGLLGADIQPDANGYFRIIKIFKGENWADNSVSPLTLPGVNAHEGDYLLEIDGAPLRLPENPYRLLEQSAGKITALKLGKKPNDPKAWEAKVKPIRSDRRVRYLDWVENNRRYVKEKSGGRLGYIHLPDMMFDGLNEFVKSYYNQLDKEGIIIDERFNGGGFVSQIILERLRRFVAGMRLSRLFDTGTYPGAAYSGHFVMLMNMYAGSDGDYFPFFFKKYGLGPLIGTRTWGGVVGIGGFTPLMDGGYVTVPTSGVFSTEGEWVMENHGVDPDIVIDNLPNDVAKGKDPQLDKGIEILMKKIQEEPVKLAPPPPPPVKKK